MPMNKLYTKYLRNGLFVVTLVVFLGCIPIRSIAGSLERPAPHKVAIILPSGNFDKEEHWIITTKCEMAEISLIVVSLQPGIIRSEGEYSARSAAYKVKVDIPLYRFTADDVDALVFIGGYGAAEYFQHPTMHAIVRKSVQQGKVVAAIDWAAIILANAGVLEGKRATTLETISKLITDKGGVYTGEAVTVDGKLITANDADAASAFAEAVIQALQQ